MSSRVAPGTAGQYQAGTQGQEKKFPVWLKAVIGIIAFGLLVLLIVWCVRKGIVKKKKSMTSCDKGGTLAPIPMSDIKRCWMPCCSGNVQLTPQECQSVTGAKIAAPSYGYNGDDKIEDPPGPC